MFSLFGKILIAILGNFRFDSTRTSATMIFLKLSPTNSNSSSLWINCCLQDMMCLKAGCNEFEVDFQQQNLVVVVVLTVVISKAPYHYPLNKRYQFLVASGKTVSC